MKLFKSTTNEVFAYELDGSQDHLISEELTPITSEEASIIIKENEVSELNSLSYTEKRARAYPNIADQLDMQYWDSINGTTIWADTIAAIKAKYSKS